jgi:hypothetical protein
MSSTMREPFTDQNGFTFTRTELDHVIVGRDACPEAIAAADLDGDGWGDLIAIESPGFQYAAQTLVALHGPSGRVVWRALGGQIGKRLVLVDGVVVVESADAASLFGVEARTGQTLWSTRLSASLADDAHGEMGTWNAPALSDCGAGFVGFATEDDHAQVLHARTGRIVVSKHARLLEYGHGLPGVALFLTVDASHDKTIEVWDLTRNGALLTGGVHNGAPLALSPEGSAYLFHAERLPSGVPMTRVASFEVGSKRPLRSVFVTPGKGNVLPHNGLASDPQRMAALGGDRLILASDDEERGGGIVISLDAPTKQAPNVPPSVQPISRMPPPQPGYKLRLVERFGSTVALVWEQDRTHTILVVGYDVATLEPRWFVGDAGGTDLKNHALRTDYGLLVPFALSGREENRPGAINYWAHVDPASGQQLAQYAVHELDCVRVWGKYLLGHSTSFPGAPPVLWDLERRERLL